VHCPQITSRHWLPGLLLFGLIGCAAPPKVLPHAAHAAESVRAASPPVAGNKVILLQDGRGTYDAMFTAIASARDHINMEMYIFDDDEAGERFANALIAKQREGVQVNLVRDSVGTMRTNKQFFERMEDAGIAVLEYNPINPLAARKDWDLNERDHRKLLIVDGRQAILGGVNISGVYSSGSSRPSATKRRGPDLPWRDTDLRIEGPVVAEFQKLFMQTWAEQHGPTLAQRRYFPPLRPIGKDSVSALGRSPDGSHSLIYPALIAAIAGAQREVWLTNAYFAPDPQLLTALKAAATRGVDVKLLLPGASDSWLVFHAGRAYYDELLRGGVQIFERRNALLHSKTALIDGAWSAIGSTNLDWRSFLHNQELDAVILGPEFGGQMRSTFQRDLAASNPITLEQWQRRPLDQRLKETLGRLWEYWL
jgi:cardiolipin synthase